ncbi:FkbM family methyltransferase [Rhodopirellula sp.]|nr:FkbM family methyltransferase [Rhodopirellula sp.]MDB4679018.1 FkbM family methyltransferase [Rhodopirellula sp.]
MPKNTPIAQSICAGEYEKEIVGFLEALISPDDCCFDIGGHYGYYTLALAKLAHQGRVHTFEPVEAHAARIEQATHRSKLDHVTVHHLAVAGENGPLTLNFASDEGDDSMAFLDVYGGVDTPAARDQYGAFQTTSVQAVTLDKAKMDFGPPRFIKIDAEGAEGAILEGGRQLIAQTRPRMLIEVHGICEAMHCANVLQPLNYRAVLLSKQKTTLPVLWIPSNDHAGIEIVKEKLGEMPITFFNE